jgi:hypothetical protein
LSRAIPCLKLPVLSPNTSAEKEKMAAKWIVKEKKRKKKPHGQGRILKSSYPGPPQQSEDLRQEKTT